MSDCAASDSESYFLSYCRADGDFALRMAKDLRDQGVAMWVDQFDIRPSEQWDRAIERALRCCRGLVVIVSPRSVASDNVMDEIAFAIASGKAVLPVMIEKCVLPLRIIRMHLIDATANYETALQQCLAELRRPKDAHEPRKDAPPLVERPPISLDDETLSTAKRRLLPIIGPIADILVDKAAKRAGSAEELQKLLLQHIHNEDDRQRFIGPQGPSEPVAAAAKSNASHEQIAERSAIPAKQFDSIASALTRYIGPIAPIVAKRESRLCSSLQELRQRLAALIPADVDRAEFLRAVGGEIDAH